jgi:hypothetical protein
MGVVLANQSTLVRKSRFVGNRESAAMLLGGAARLEENEILATAGVAISVNAGSEVLLSHNRLVENLSTAISVRDSEVEINGNTLIRNALGIVTVTTGGNPRQEIADNRITQTAGDAITLIGGTPAVLRNQLTANRGAAIRSLDLVQERGQIKAVPRLEANVSKGNGSDKPVLGTYSLKSAP